jgi:hypothetical protein
MDDEELDYGESPVKLPPVSAAAAAQAAAPAAAPATAAAAPTTDVDADALYGDLFAPSHPPPAPAAGGGAGGGSGAPPLGSIAALELDEVCCLGVAARGIRFFSPSPRARARPPTSLFAPSLHKKTTAPPPGRRPGRHHRPPAGRGRRPESRGEVGLCQGGVGVPAPPAFFSIHSIHPSPPLSHTPSSSNKTPTTSATRGGRSGPLS